MPGAPGRGGLRPGLALRRGREQPQRDQHGGAHHDARTGGAARTSASLSSPILLRAARICWRSESTFRDRSSKSAPRASAASCLARGQDRRHPFLQLVEAGQQLAVLDHLVGGALARRQLLRRRVQRRRVLADRLEAPHQPGELLGARLDLQRPHADHLGLRLLRVARGPQRRHQRLGVRLQLLLAVGDLLERLGRAFQVALRIERALAQAGGERGETLQRLVERLGGRDQRRCGRLRLRRHQRVQSFPSLRFARSASSGA